MKNLYALCLALFCGIVNLQASNTLPVPPLTTEQTTNMTPRAQELTRRLEEIKVIDQSQLNARERKALRKEVRQIKRDTRGGIYISASALIVILIIVLILL